MWRSSGTKNRSRIRASIRSIGSASRRASLAAPYLVWRTHHIGRHSQRRLFLLLAPCLPHRQELRPHHRPAHLRRPLLERHRPLRILVVVLEPPRGDVGVQTALSLGSGAAPGSAPPPGAGTPGQAARGGSIGPGEAVAEFGKGMTEGLHKHLWEKIQAGATSETKGGPTSGLLQAAKRIRARGGLQNFEQYKAFAQDDGNIQTGPNFQSDMRALVERHVPKAGQTPRCRPQAPAAAALSVRGGPARA